MSFDLTQYGTARTDVPYGAADAALKLDLYFPPSGGPWPGLVFIHGGGWTEGDKAPLPVIPTAAGYLVASINYRLYPAHRFPAMIEDVKRAIRFLRAQAAPYHLDPRRIALVGHSAGGHLAALAGLAGADAGWDTGPDLDQSSRVQAVVAISGPADLTLAFPDWVEGLKTAVFGAEQLTRGSPVTYAAPDAPPFLIIHGDADEAVPVEQARRLHAALMRAGAPSELLILHNGGHGLEPAGGPLQPGMDEVLGQMLAFLARALGD